LPIEGLAVEEIGRRAAVGESNGPHARVPQPTDKLTGAGDRAPAEIDRARGRAAQCTAHIAERIGEPIAAVLLGADRGLAADALE
jgi:hypothetical protein